MVDFRSDGVMRNAVLGIGGIADVDEHSRPMPLAGQQYTASELEGFYARSAIARKVVNLIPDRAQRGGFLLQQGHKPVDAKLSRAVRHTGIGHAISKASKLSRMYRSGSVVLIVDDNQDGQPNWDKPINKNQIKSVSVGFVADGERLRPIQRSIIQIPSSHYQMALQDDLATERSAEQQQQLDGLRLNQVHSDRILSLEGTWTPPNVEVRLDGTLSVLAGFFDPWSRYEAALSAASNLMNRSEMLVIKKENFNLLLSGASAAEEASLKREARNIRDRANRNSVLFADKNTDYEVISRKLSDIKPLLDEFRFNVVAASGGLTELDLFGLSTQTSALSSRDIGDRMATAAIVQDYQEFEVRDPLEKFLELLFLSKDGPTKGNELKDWEIEFPTTLQLTVAEEVDLKSKMAATDKEYVAMGLPAELVLKSRFSGTGRMKQRYLKTSC